MAGGEGGGGERIVPGGEGAGEYEDRGSRFLAWVFPAPAEDDLRRRLEELRAEHPKARHHCWAWFGDASHYRFADDGEPGGTAGRPMLQVLEGSGLVEVGAVCVRYFGGVKLGTGGLARAYAGAVARALDGLPRRVVPAVAEYWLRLPFDLLGLRNEIESLCPTARFDGAYTDQGWEGRVELTVADAARFEQILEEHGAGRARWTRAVD
ncbi:MAG: YigZ family protein [Planctomycetota bacterium]|nr:MAG: YigZ family protein [Planctomycetota bacterium]